jgi:RNA polymerase sigma factor (sigma-70 family)
MKTNASELTATRETLLNRLKDWGDQESWREFFQIYWRLLFSIARQAGLTEVEAQDAVQEIVISVAKKMPKFQYNPARCSFKTWLWHLARKRIAGRSPAYQSLESQDASTASRTSTVERMADPSSIDLVAFWEREWEQQVLILRDIW